MSFEEGFSVRHEGGNGKLTDFSEHAEGEETPLVLRGHQSTEQSSDNLFFSLVGQRVSTDIGGMKLTIAYEEKMS